MKSMSKDITPSEFISQLETESAADQTERSWDLVLTHKSSRVTETYSMFIEISGSQSRYVGEVHSTDPSVIGGAVTALWNPETYEFSMVVAYWTNTPTRAIVASDMSWEGGFFTGTAVLWHSTLEQAFKGTTRIEVKSGKLPFNT